MKRYKRYILLLLSFFVAFGISPTLAQTPLDKSESRNLIATLTKNYDAWKSVMIDGKIPMDRLPVSPSVRIFMQKGSDLAISVRVPLIGEVGRIQLHGNEVLAVNKLRKVYVKETLGDFFTDLPVSLDDLQNLLLARAFIAGKGQLSTLNYSDCDCYYADSYWLVLPKEPIGGTVNYGFQFDEDGRLEIVSAIPEGSSVSATSFYSYNGKKIEMEVQLVMGGKEYDALLKMNSFEFGAKPLESIRLDKNYTKVGVREFLKSLSL